ncbi:HAMP domain-containing histidine kinase [Listeria sp. FSL L7-0091]|uniref:histidine kinase n=1 Tax=Listeria farberi TaxID=2713500 RepID=A0A7X1DDR3_9LIST|nr:two component system sensor histidine kinase PieS [Listeria farberi]MBC1374094.1 HAMP domain-containing histidine kinase [Listeria farberi]MBC1381254.1 HAMP domain-containing histidine kinase [Listeria farberi]MBC2260738.1 HAMP domain-containing histidine kinase [Listeria farberi]MBC2267462.1 HAMP domain-containing histidine kinase [Listeria farberi]MBC2286923.1 HAMP domain-containing histidine kinase [Listeria farberi]
MKRMKFKYAYQLFFTQFIILLIACIMIGVLVSHSLKDYFYQSQVDDLTSYGETISMDIRHSPQDATIQVLNTYQRILDVKKIHYTIKNADDETIYPAQLNQPLPKDFSISKDDKKKLKSGETVSKKIDNRFNREMTIVYVPIMDGDKFVGSIVLNSPISGTEQVIGTINRYMFYTILLSITIALILSAILSKLQVNRINKLRSATKDVIQGNYKARLKENNFDEIGALAIDFNKMTQTLETSQEEIERQEKRRRQFIADVSHEMRTPLTTISGLTEGLVNDIIPKSETDRCIALIDTEAKRLTKLVNENLDYEKIRSNKIKLQKTRFNGYEFLELIKEQLDYVANEKGNAITVNIDKDMFIYADYDRLTQVFINIVKNSVQFTKNGKITLTGTQDYKESVLTITDTGIGMNTEELEQIWERFYKADMSRTNTAFGESGIGLSIVKQLIEYHDGTISASSEPNKGTTFTIRLPFFQDNEQ